MRTWPKKTSAASVNAVGHLDVLRAEQQPAPIVAIGDHAADQREQQDRQLAQEIIEPEEERGLGEVEDEPALRDLLHPGADGRGEGPEPQDAEIAVAKGGKCPESTTDASTAAQPGPIAGVRGSAGQGTSILRHN